MRFQLSSLLRRITRYRSTRLTSEGAQFLLFTLAIGFAAINTGNNLFYLLLAMMLSLILISGIVAEYCLRRLEFHRHLPDLLFVKEPVTASLVMKNRKSRLPSFSLRIFDVCDGVDVDRRLEVPQLFPGTNQFLSYQMIPSRRGRLRLEGVRVVTAFPFGLFVKKAFYSVEGTAVVCPEIKPLDDRFLRDLLTAGRGFNAKRRGYGTDLYNLRLYQTGDDSRSIHWPTTARTSKLIVRETEAEDQRQVTIHLSTIAPASHNDVFEQAVSFTASVVHHLANQGYLLRLVVGVERSSFGQGASHLRELLQQLALCERTAPELKFDHIEEYEPERLESDDGTSITVRPWTGGPEERRDSFTVLINGEVASPSYAS